MKISPENVRVSGTIAEEPIVEKPVRYGGRFVPGDPRINRTKAGPGRPRSEVKELLGRERAENIAFLRKLRDSTRARMRDRLDAVIHMLAYDIGKPAQVLEGEGEQLIVTVRTVEGTAPWVAPEPKLEHSPH